MPAAKRPGFSQAASLHRRRAHGQVTKYGALAALAAILYLATAGFNALASRGANIPGVGAVRDPALHRGAGNARVSHQSQVRPLATITPTATPACGAVVHR